MRKAKPSRIERLESQLVKVIQEKGADQNQHGGMVLKTNADLLNY